MGQDAGWYRDPFHREQERYWDGRLWTQGTRPVEAEAAGASDVSDAWDQIADTDEIDWLLMEEETAETIEEPPSAPTVPSFAPLGAPVRPAVTPAMGAAATTGSGHGGRQRRRRGVAFGVSMAAVVLILGGLFAVFGLGGGGGGTSGEASAAEAVSTAATRTIGADSADVSMSLSASTTGMDESLTGTGSFDFTQKAGTMTMTIPVDGQQYSEQEILDNSTIYVNVSGLDTGLAPSVPWVSIPAETDHEPTDISTLDATALLHQLQSAGGSATSLGQTAYDNTTVTEYQTTLPPSVLESEMGALPSSSGQSLGLDLPDMTIDVYVTLDGLLKAVAVPTYSFDIAGQTISVSSTVAFSNFGTPVNVTPPPPDQVEPFSQLFSGLGNSGSTGNSGNSGNSGTTT